MADDRSELEIMLADALIERLAATLIETDEARWEEEGHTAPLGILPKDDPITHAFLNGDGKPWKGGLLG